MKKAIIIGATSGIGKSLALKLTQQGYLIGITGRRNRLLEVIRQENPDKILTLTMDVTQLEETLQNLQNLVEKIGGLDLLVISAGTGELNEVLDFKLEQPTLETNVLGFTNIMDWAYRFFENQGNGHLVAITSVGGLYGNPIAPAYNASKAFQINYLDGIRQKARRQKLPIIITDIRPGFVKTDMAKGDGQFWVAPVEVATKQIFTAIRRKKSKAYITRRWTAIGFFLKLRNLIWL